MRGPRRGVRGPCGVGPCVRASACLVSHIFVDLAQRSLITCIISAAASVYLGREWVPRAEGACQSCVSIFLVASNKTLNVVILSKHSLTEWKSDFTQQMCSQTWALFEELLESCVWRAQAFSWELGAWEGPGVGLSKVLRIQAVDRVHSELPNLLALIGCVIWGKELNLSLPLLLHL